MNIYKAIFEFDNSGIGTWEDYSPNVDLFVNKLIKNKGERIAKFLEIYQKIYKPKYNEKHIKIRKYNELIQKKGKNGN